AHSTVKPIVFDTRPAATTETSTWPVTPLGTSTMIEVSLHADGVPGAVPNRTVPVTSHTGLSLPVLGSWQKYWPNTVTIAPTGARSGAREPIRGAGVASWAEHPSTASTRIVARMSLTRVAQPADVDLDLTLLDSPRWSRPRPARAGSSDQLRRWGPPDREL